MLSSFNSMLSMVDQAIYGRQAAAVKLEHDPLFILGHWRSGTTFLHELLIRDPEHNYATTYQCFAPHHFLTSDWMTQWIGFLLPKRRPMDNMAAGWDRPQEDEFALQNLGVPTPYLSIMFPDNGPVYPEYLTLHGLTDEQRRAWQQKLDLFFKRISLRDGRRLVVKSPPHTARIRTLLEMYPQAKFIHLARDPYALFSSTVGLWKSLNFVQGARIPRDESWIKPYVIDSLQRMYEAYFEDRSLLARGQLMELRYEDLVENPKERLREAYDFLGLGDFGRVEAAIDDHLKDVKSYRVNRHTAADDDSRSELRRLWGPYFEKFGYE